MLPPAVGGKNPHRTVTLCLVSGLKGRQWGGVQLRQGKKWMRTGWRGRLESGLGPPSDEQLPASQQFAGTVTPAFDQPCTTALPLQIVGLLQMVWASAAPYGTSPTWKTLSHRTPSDEQGLVGGY